MTFNLNNKTVVLCIFWKWTVKCLEKILVECIQNVSKKLFYLLTNLLTVNCHSTVRPDYQQQKLTSTTSSF